VINPDRESWTAYAESHGLVREAPAVPRPNKYHAEAIHVDGVRFASKKEAARFLELQLWQKHGQIDELECQPVFPLHVLELWRSGLPVVITTIGKYTADFRYRNLHTGEIVVEDVKSTATRTEAYTLRKKAAEAIHGITVVEV
jgi:hypothetical protein